MDFEGQKYFLGNPPTDIYPNKRVAVLLIKCNKGSTMYQQFCTHIYRAFFSLFYSYEKSGLIKLLRK